jgi:hypothetical protein
MPCQDTSPWFLKRWRLEFVIAFHLRRVGHLVVLYQDPKLPIQQYVVRWMKNRAWAFILGTLSTEADCRLRTNCSIWASMGVSGVE